MIWFYFLLLTVLTLLGGSIPFLVKSFKSEWMTYMLAFSGAFLLGITLLHLLPESVHELQHEAGIYILIGFFIQLLLQRISHGVEHGHIHDHHTHVHGISPIFLGLCIHAFMEGIPLGFNYQNTSTMPSIFLGVAAHKIPEAVTLSALVLMSNSKKNKWVILLFFALVSPASGMLAMYYGQKFQFISNLLVYIIPVVIGAFLHISTTILYESGTKSHELSRQKVISVLLGLSFALATLLFPHE
ncbi:MAG: ZIP family metal transporter [Chitinophagaceae bacterium]|nr:ZIP family metal transporter [Chitinophagaceae bacterium]